MALPVVLNGPEPEGDQSFGPAAAGPDNAGVSPETYEEWRRSTLGSITEALENEVVFGLSGPLENRRLLDVGCGDGAYRVEAAHRGATISGVDISLPILNAPRHRVTDNGVDADLHLDDAETLPFDDAAFDVVTAITTPCFLQDPSRAVNEMARVLTPCGRLILGEIGRQ